MIESLVMPAAVPAAMESSSKACVPARGEASCGAACGEFRPGIKIRMFGMKFSVVEASAVGNKSVVVVDDRPPMPVESPVVPSPPKAAEEAGSKSETKSDLGSVIENAGN